MKTEKPVPLIPTRYSLPWTRIRNAEPWMRAEVVARKFDTSGKPTQWIVFDHGSVLSKEDNDFEYEPQPRDADFVARTRFDSPEEAAEFARKFFEP